MYMNDLNALQTKSGVSPKPRKPKSTKEEKFANKIKAILESPNRGKFKRQNSNHMYVSNLKGLKAGKGPK